jgi:hypothetical protein
VIYHVSSHPALVAARPGDVFTLIPGPQHAEGLGVYFSESEPRLTAAEGAGRLGLTGVVAIEPASPDGWWRSKGGKARKFGKARTWHSDGKNVRCQVREVRDGVTYCDFIFKQ